VHLDLTDQDARRTFPRVGKARFRKLSAPSFEFDSVCRLVPQNQIGDSALQTNTAVLRELLRRKLRNSRRIWSPYRRWSEEGIQEVAHGNVRIALARFRRDQLEC